MGMFQKFVTVYCAKVVCVVPNAINKTLPFYGEQSAICAGDSASYSLKLVVFLIKSVKYFLGII